MDLAQEVENELTNSLTENEGKIKEDETLTDHTETTDKVDDTTNEELPPAEKSKVGVVLLLLLAIVLFFYFKTNNS
jgi:hypothetical protein